VQEEKQGPAIGLLDVGSPAMRSFFVGVVLEFCSCLRLGRLVGGRFGPRGAVASFAIWVRHVTRRALSCAGCRGSSSLGRPRPLQRRLALGLGPVAVEKLAQGHTGLELERTQRHRRLLALGCVARSPRQPRAQTGSLSAKAERQSLNHLTWNSTTDINNHRYLLYEAVPIRTTEGHM